MDKMFDDTCHCGSNQQYNTYFSDKMFDDTCHCGSNQQYNTYFSDINFNCLQGTGMIVLNTKASN